MKILQVQRFRQVCPNSCTAAVAQMAAYFFGNFLTPQESINLINSYPDGQTLKIAAQKIGQKFKIRHKWLGTIKQIENFIDKYNCPIMSGDDNLFGGPHSILIVGYDEQDFYLADPNRADTRKANKEKLFENSDEFYGVFKEKIIQK